MQIGADVDLDWCGRAYNGPLCTVKDHLLLLSPPHCVWRADLLLSIIIDSTQQ